MEQFNIEYYSYLSCGGGAIRLPLHISINKIQDADYYNPPNYRNTLHVDIAPHQDGVSIVHDQTPHFFYGKFEEILIMRWQLGIIYDFIDFKSMRYFNELEKWNNLTKDEFTDIMLNTGMITFNELANAWQQLLFYIQKIKNEFTNGLIELLEMDVEMPHVFLRNDNPIPQKYKDFMAYSPGLVELQMHVELTAYPPIFQENMNRAIHSYSWREKELRRLYTTQKTKIDNFIEQVKSFMMEEQMQK